MQSDRDAPAHRTSWAAWQRGVGSLRSVLVWAVLLATIVMSFQPPVPVIWGDTPAFVESGFLTLDARRPTVVGGRDPGYPIFLALDRKSVV